jgi:hypothetical protein
MWVQEAHERLYNDAKAQRDKIERVRSEARDVEIEAATKQRGESRMCPREANDSGNRLYQRSLRQQEEGRKRRESIERKVAPRPPTPSGSIRPEEANKIYERGMVKKLQREIIAERSNLMKDYVSPILNPLVEDQSKPTMKTTSDKLTSKSRIRARSRIRSMSPSVRPNSANPRQPSLPRKQTPSTMTKPGTPNMKYSYGSRNNTPTTRTSTPNSRSSTPATRNSTPTMRSSTPTMRSSTPNSRRWNTPLRKAPNTRTRSPTPARVRQNQY